MSPKASGGGLRLALKDVINGKDVEYQINAPTLATGQWMHLAAVLRDNYMTFYVGAQADTYNDFADGLHGEEASRLERRESRSSRPAC